MSQTSQDRVKELLDLGAAHVISPSLSQTAM